MKIMRFLTLKNQFNKVSVFCIRRLRLPENRPPSLYPSRRVCFQRIFSIFNSCFCFGWSCVIACYTFLSSKIAQVSYLSNGLISQFPHAKCFLVSRMEDWQWRCCKPSQKMNWTLVAMLHMFVSAKNALPAALGSWVSLAMLSLSVLGQSKKDQRTLQR